MQDGYFREGPVSIHILKGGSKMEKQANLSGFILCFLGVCDCSDIEELAFPSSGVSYFPNHLKWFPWAETCHHFCVTLKHSPSQRKSGLYVQLTHMWLVIIYISVYLMNVLLVCGDWILFIFVSPVTGTWSLVCKHWLKPDCILYSQWTTNTRNSNTARFYETFISI